MTGVHGYRKMIDEISGHEPSALPEGWSVKDFKWNDPQNSWYASVYYDPSGVPQKMAWYEWQVDESHFKAGVKLMLGEDFVLDRTWGGNGHYDALIVRKP